MHGGVACRELVSEGGGCFESSSYSLSRPRPGLPGGHPPGRQEPLAPTSLASKPCRCYSATHPLSHHRHITRPVPFQVTVPFSLVPLVKLSCSRWVAGPLFGGDWLARLCWANVVMVLTLPRTFP